MVACSRQGGCIRTFPASLVSCGRDGAGRGFVKVFRFRSTRSSYVPEQGRSATRKARSRPRKACTAHRRRTGRLVRASGPSVSFEHPGRASGVPRAPCGAGWSSAILPTTRQFRVGHATTRLGSGSIMQPCDRHVGPAQTHPPRRGGRFQGLCRNCRSRTRFLHRGAYPHHTLHHSTRQHAAAQPTRADIRRRGTCQFP